MSRLNIVLKTKQKSAIFMVVNPETSDFWLTNHNNINRNVQKASVLKEARDMTNGRWITTHEGIAFDWNGEAMDGQHRLLAIKESGLAQELLVVRGLDPAGRMVVNTGRPRRPADILKLLGREGVTTNNVAVVRQIMNGLNRRATIPEIVDAWDIHNGAAKTAIAMFPSNLKRIGIAPVYGVMAVASYTQDLQKLQEFADVLYTGRGNGKKGHSAPLILRQYLEDLPSRGDGLSKYIYGVTEFALLSFLANEKVKELEATKEEVFTIPKRLTKPAPKPARPQVRLAMAA